MTLYKYQRASKKSMLTTWKNLENLEEDIGGPAEVDTLTARKWA